MVVVPLCSGPLHSCWNTGETGGRVSSRARGHGGQPGVPYLLPVNVQVFCGHREGRGPTHQQVWAEG